MELGEAILAVGAGKRPASFNQFSAAIDGQWIAEALAATGTASVRRRKLPAEHVVWLVIGMGLFRDRSIAEVVHPARSGWPLDDVLTQAAMTGVLLRSLRPRRRSRR